MTALPARSSVSGTPSRATANAGFGAQYDFINERLAAGTATIAEKLATRQALGISIPRAHIAGLTLSTAGSSTTMSIAAGQAADSGNVVLIDLASAIAKTTSSWAVGTAQGGLDTGSIANNTWYHFHLIRRPDTGVVDVLLSLSATAPTMPTNYTQSRRIGSGRTNGSGQWVSFVQDGDFFQWASPTLDVDVTGTGTSAVTRTLVVPSGVNVRALMNVSLENTSAESVYLSDLATTDVAPSTVTAPLGTAHISASGRIQVQADVRTNTSSQIRSRLLVGGGSTVLRISTVGWTDSRGANL